MEQKAFVNDNRIALPESCSREHAVELHRLLTDRLAELSDSEPAPERAELDLSGVRELDACGCQLLVLFMEHLKRRGIAPSPCGQDGEISRQIALLGFSDAFSPNGSHGQQ